MSQSDSKWLNKDFPEIFTAKQQPSPVDFGEVTHVKVDNWLLEATQQGHAKPLLDLMWKYRSLFVDEIPGGILPPRVIDHTIPLVPDVTITKSGSPKATREAIDTVRQVLTQLLSRGWICRTSSPHAAPAMMVPKKGDPIGSPGARIVIHYRAVNVVTVAADFPIPLIEDVLTLHGAKVFTIMDMEQGFHQVRMAPGDRFKTAFRTFMGQLGLSCRLDWECWRSWAMH